MSQTEKVTAAMMEANRFFTEQAERNIANPIPAGIISNKTLPAKIAKYLEGYTLCYSFTKTGIELEYVFTPYEMLLVPKNDKEYMLIYIPKTTKNVIESNQAQDVFTKTINTNNESEAV